MRACVLGRQSRQSRRTQLRIALLLTISLLTGLACLYAVSRRRPVVRTGELVVDHSTEQPLFTFVPNADTNSPARPVYPYSVIPGGISSGRELAMRMAADSVASKHYSGFNVSRARVVRASRDKRVYVAYRVHDKVFWTKKRLKIREGEELITDGINYARARCGNRITDFPVPPTLSVEPSTMELDPPLPPSSPPVLLPSTAVTTEPPILPVYFPPYVVPSFGVPPSGGPSPSATAQPVPEPKTIWLACIGAACVLVQLWRKRRKERGRNAEVVRAAGTQKSSKIVR